MLSPIHFLALLPPARQFAVVDRRMFACMHSNCMRPTTGASEQKRRNQQPNMVAASHEAVNKDFRLADTVLYYTGCTAKG